MYFSKIFVPTSRDNPSEAELVSHKLMVRSGMIKRTAAGIYNWLPIGLKILKKIEEIVRKNLDETGAQEILMPMVQPSDLWKESERFNEYGKELLVFSDRSKREFVLGPTHEEVVSDIFRSYPISYKNLPINFYQIQTKFRDEIRPRFGVMRAREFIMKDAYSFDINKKGLEESYKEMKNAYIKIFNEIGLEYRVVNADSGNIGGDKSEEFHVLAESGEDLLAISDESSFAANVETFDQKEDPSNLIGRPSPDGKGKLIIKRGIEVGHIFQLGQKYSNKMKVLVKDENATEIPIFMGCYGIGITRILGACIEQNNDKNGIIWPKSIAPFDINIICLDPGKKEVFNSSLNTYKLFKEFKFDVLLDDRDMRPGNKFADHDLIGIPFSVVISGSNYDKNKLEVGIRGKNEKFNLTPEELKTLMERQND
ncbi:MAG: proline--tRNA ligase [Thiotrichales bacterium TMED285]|nr:MAG: proline--tRNA ligase [Thiotrichales bacterium TMED285]